MDLEEGGETRHYLRSLEMVDATTAQIDAGSHPSGGTHVPSPDSAEALDVSTLIRSHEILHHRHYHHLHRHHHHEVLSNHADRFVAMGALDILRESVTILRAKSSTLMALMLLLICPVSGVLLSHAFLHGKLADKLAAHLYVAAGSVGFLHYLSLVKSTYRSLAHVLLSYMFAAPVLFTVWLLAKASIIYVVSGTYANRSDHLFDSLGAGVRLWRHVFSTYIWNSLIILGFGTVAAIIFLVAVSLLDALQFSADLVFLMELALGLFYSVIFAQILVVGSLAYVVSILEEQYGLPALVRSFHLIKGKIQVALSLFCGILLGTFMVETLYQYRVIGIPPSNYVINMASRLWEGPLLVFMHSFLLLLDAIMSCVFYFTCKSSTFVLSGEEQHLVGGESFT